MKNKLQFYKKNFLRLLVLALSFYFFNVGLILSYGFSDKLDSSDVCVVLGNQVLPDGTPSRTLKSRLDRAVEVYSLGLCKRVIVSGGIDMNGFDEALVMKQYLMEKGNIPGEKIIPDNTGTNTRNTARFCKKYFSETNTRSAMLVTSYSHIFRTRLSFAFEGLDVTGHAHGKYFFEARNFYSVFREVIGIYYYLLKEPFIHNL